MQTNDLNGKWTYRSFHNRAAPVGGDPQKALNLIFAEATFSFEVVSETELQGAIDWAGGGLDLQGRIRDTDSNDLIVVELVGLGRSKTPTEGWEYDYNAAFAHTWPNGVNQVPALTGSVIRAKPHGAAAAGYVASFIAVKQT